MLGDFPIPEDPLIRARTHVYPGSVPQVGEMGPVPPAKPLLHVIDPNNATEAQGENSGGNVNYYLVEIKHPKRLKSYWAECEDIIEALGMNFAEGTAFKAIWRRCAQKKLGVKKEGDTPKRNAEKVIYYGERMLAQDEADEG